MQKNRKINENTNKIEIFHLETGFFLLLWKMILAEHKNGKYTRNRVYRKCSDKQSCSLTEGEGPRYH